MSLASGPRIVGGKKSGIGGARHRRVSKLCQTPHLPLPDDSAIRHRRNEKTRRLQELLEERVCISTTEVGKYAFGESKLVANLRNGDGAVAKHMNN